MSRSEMPYAKLNIPLPSKKLEIHASDTELVVGQKIDAYFEDIIRNYPDSTKVLVRDMYYHNTNIIATKGMLEKDKQATWKVDSYGERHEFHMMMDARLFNSPITFKLNKIHEIAVHIGQAHQRIEQVGSNIFYKEFTALNKFTEQSVAIQEKFLLDALPLEVIERDCMQISDENSREKLLADFSTRKTMHPQDYFALKHRKDNLTDTDRFIFHRVLQAQKYKQLPFRFSFSSLLPAIFSSQLHGEEAPPQAQISAEEIYMDAVREADRNATHVPTLLYMEVNVPLPSKKLDINPTDTSEVVYAKIDAYFDDIIRHYPPAIREMLNDMYYDEYHVTTEFFEGGIYGTCTIKKFENDIIQVHVENEFIDCPVAHRLIKIHEIAVHVGQQLQRIEQVGFEAFSREMSQFRKLTEQSVAIAEKILVDALPENIIANDLWQTYKFNQQAYRKFLHRNQNTSFDDYLHLQHRGFLDKLTPQDCELFFRNPQVAAFLKNDAQHFYPGISTEYMSTEIYRTALEKYLGTSSETSAVGAPEPLHAFILRPSPEATETTPGKFAHKDAADSELRNVVDRERQRFTPPQHVPQERAYEFLVKEITFQAQKFNLMVVNVIWDPERSPFYDIEFVPARAAIIDKKTVHVTFDFAEQTKSDLERLAESKKFESRAYYNQLALRPPTESISQILYLIEERFLKPINRRLGEPLQVSETHRVIGPKQLNPAEMIALRRHVLFHPESRTLQFQKRFYTENFNGVSYVEAMNETLRNLERKYLSEKTTSKATKSITFECILSRSRTAQINYSEGGRVVAPFVAPAQDIPPKYNPALAKLMADIKESGEYPALTVSADATHESSVVPVEQTHQSQTAEQEYLEISKKYKEFEAKTAEQEYAEIEAERRTFQKSTPTESTSTIETKNHLSLKEVFDFFKSKPNATATAAELEAFGITRGMIQNYKMARNPILRHAGEGLVQFSEDNFNLEYQPKYNYRDCCEIDRCRQRIIPAHGIPVKEAGEFGEQKIRMYAQRQGLTVTSFKYPTENYGYEVEYFPARLNVVDENISHVVFDHANKTPETLHQLARSSEGAQLWESGNYFRKLANAPMHPPVGDILLKLIEHHPNLGVPIKISEMHYSMNPLPISKIGVEDTPYGKFDHTTRTLFLDEAFYHSENCGPKLASLITKHNLGTAAKAIASITFRGLTVVGVYASLANVARAEDKPTVAGNEFTQHLVGFMGSAAAVGLFNPVTFWPTVVVALGGGIASSVGAHLLHRRAAEINAQQQAAKSQSEAMAKTYFKYATSEAQKHAVNPGKYSPAVQLPPSMHYVASNYASTLQHSFQINRTPQSTSTSFSYPQQLQKSFEPFYRSYAHDEFGRYVYDEFGRPKSAFQANFERGKKNSLFNEAQFILSTEKLNFNTNWYTRSFPSALSIFSSAARFLNLSSSFCSSAIRVYEKLCDEIAGAEAESGIIKGVKDAMRPEEYLIFINGVDSINSFNMQRISMEIYRGYKLKADVAISLHFNDDNYKYPVMHPAYHDTLVGEVISFLDYWMVKGFLNGGTFDADFLRSWPNTKAPGKVDVKSLEKHITVDFKKYCKEHLPANMKYMSLLERIAEADIEGAGFTEEKLRFAMTFRLIAGVESVRGADGILIFEPIIRIAHTIAYTPKRQQELDAYYREHQRYPDDYYELEKICTEAGNDLLAQMPLLPMFKSYFDMLKVIAVNSYLLPTLKSMKQEPVFADVELPSIETPTAFPPNPVRSYRYHPLSISTKTVVEKIGAAYLNPILFAMLNDMNHVNKADAHITSTVRDLIKKELPDAEWDERKIQKIVDEFKDKMRAVVIAYLDPEINELFSKNVKEIQKKIPALGNLLKACEAFNTMSEKRIYLLQKIKEYEKTQLGKSLSEISKTDYDTINKVADEAIHRLRVSYATNLRELQRQLADLPRQSAEAESDIRANIEALARSQCRQFNPKLTDQAVEAEISKMKPKIEAKITELITASRAEDETIKATINQNIALNKSTYETTLADFEKTRDVNIKEKFNKLVNEPITDCKNLIEQIDVGANQLTHAMAVDKEYNIPFIKRYPIPSFEFSNNHHVIGGAGVNTARKKLQPLTDADQIMIAEFNENTSSDLKPQSVNASYVGFTLPVCDEKITAADAYAEYKLFSHAPNLPAENPILNSAGITPLWLALQNCDEDAALSIIASLTFNPRHTVFHGENYLHEAVEQSLLQVVPELIRKGVDCLRIRNGDGLTPWHLAVKKGNVELIAAMLLIKPDLINTKTLDGLTALHIVAQTGDVETLELLLEKKADASIKDKANCVALDVAITEENKVMIAILARHTPPELNNLPQPKKFNLKDARAHCDVVKVAPATSDAKNHLQQTVLQEAISKNDEESALQLISKTEEINHQDYQGNTALMLAVSMGFERVTKRLIARGADLMVRNNDGFIALHLAANYGCLQCVQLLLSKQSYEIDIRTKHPESEYDMQQTALHLAAKEGYLLVCQFLLSQNANPFLTDANGKTPMDIVFNQRNSDLFILFSQIDGFYNPESQLPKIISCLQLDNTEGLRYLLTQMNPDINVIDTFARNALHYAARYSANLCAEILIEFGCSITQCDQALNTPLHDAARSGSSSVVLELIRGLRAQTDEESNCVIIIGNFINAKNHSGKTPLILAIENNGIAESKKLEVVREFICAGVDLTITNAGGETPLQIATRLQCSAAVKKALMLPDQLRSLSRARELHRFYKPAQPALPLSSGASMVL